MHPTRHLLPLAALLLGSLAGCAAPSPDAGSPAPDPAPSASDQPESLVGSYSVEFRTTQSDRDVLTDETVVRAGTVTGSCNGDDCDLTLTLEVKAPDGSTTTTATALTFADGEYHGVQELMLPCDGLTSLTTIANGIEFTGDTTVTPTATVVEDGRLAVASFDIVVIERNEITAEGREAGCLAINPSGADPFVANATAVGVGVREP